MMLYLKTTIVALILLCMPNCAVAESERLLHANFENVNGERQVRLGWKSKHGSHYAVESATSLDGKWTVVTNGVDIQARDYLSELTTASTNDVAFFRVREIDGDGPNITFASPLQDAFGVSADSEIRISFADVSGIEKETAVLIIDDQLVDADTIAWDGDTLVYTSPNGKLGEPGQEIKIEVSIIDACGNSSNKKSSIVLAQPLVQKAESFMVLGEPDLGTYSYVGRNGGVVERPEIRLAGCTSNTLEISGVSLADLYVGQLYASMIPTNGFYRRAVDVTLLSNDVYSVKTEDASLSDFVTGTISMDNLEVVPAADDPTPVAKACTMRSLAAAPSSVEASIDKNRGFSETTEIQFPLDLTVGRLKVAQTKHFFTLTLNGRLGISGNITEEDEKIDVIMTGQVVFDYDPIIEADTSFVLTKFSLPRFSMSIGTFVIPTPVPIPIVVTAEIIPSVSASASVQEKLKFKPSYTQIGEVNLHLRKNDGQWRQCDDSRLSWNSFDNGTSGPQVSVGEIGIYGEVMFSIAFEKVIYPYVSAEAYVAYRCVGEDSLLRHLLVAGVKGKVGIELGYPGIFTVGVPFVKSDPHEKILWEATTGEAPPLIEMDETVTAQEGETVVLTPRISGTSPIKVVWSRNGIPVDESLEISFAASAASAGYYTVMASNAYGTDSKTVNVEVLENPTKKWVGTWTCEQRPLSIGPRVVDQAHEYYYNKYAGEKAGKYAGWIWEWQKSTMQRTANYRLIINEDLSFEYTCRSRGDDYLHGKYKQYDEWNKLMVWWDVESWYENYRTVLRSGRLALVEDDEGEKTVADGAFRLIIQDVTIVESKGVDSEEGKVDTRKRYPYKSANPAEQSTEFDGMRLNGDDEILWRGNLVWRRVK